MAGEKTETIYDGKHYIVESTIKNKDRPFLVFFPAYSDKELKDKPQLGRQSHMRRLALGNDYNYISILPQMSDWYQRPEIDDAIKAVMAKTEGRKRIGYGQSMGGYGILNYYHDLKLSNVIVVAPNATCNRSLIPFDDRMEGIEKDLGNKGVTPERDRLLTQAPIPHGYILYDPHNFDGRHARMILAKHPDLTSLPMRFCGHAPVGLLKELETDEKWLLIMMRDTDFSRETFMKDLREGSHQSPEFNFTLAQRLGEHHWYRAALKVIMRANALKKNFFPALAYQGEMLCHNGQYFKAFEILGPMAGHPKHTARALNVLADFVGEVRDKNLRARYLSVLKTTPGGDLAMARASEEAAAKGKKIKVLKTGGGFFSGVMSKVFG